MHSTAEHDFTKHALVRITTWGNSPSSASFPLPRGPRMSSRGMSLWRGASGATAALRWPC